MSNLPDLAASGRSVPELPGITLSPPELHDYGTVEAEFERAHLATAAASAYSDGMPLQAQDHLIRAANDFVAEGRLKYGSRDFDLQLFVPTWVPFLVWVLGRAKTPTLLRKDAAAMVKAQGARNAAHAVILELFGVVKKEKADDKKGEAKAPPDSTGPQSTSSSAGAESSPPISSAA